MTERAARILAKRIANRYRNGKTHAASQAALREYEKLVAQLGYDPLDN